ncbi:MAG: DUF881 domain-containing protein [Tindallia sp. MSAO_Bac2]|nr:MAG: DUF881 domain-containing protein [Tindallia sp. MSAO_Bac2]
MKETKGKIAIAFICALLGLVVAMQIKSVQEVAEGGFLSTQQAQKMTAELRNLRAEKDQLTEELTDLENRLRDYELSEADENLLIKNLKNDLLRYQLLAGYIEGKGPGVIVEVSDPPAAFNQPDTDSFIMYNYEILLALINTLNAAGAEAISINDQRYVSTTEIYYSSNSLYINDTATTPPYTIKAIGNPETLEAALNMRYGIVWDMRNYYNLQVDVSKSEEIMMSRYNRVYEFEYAKPMETIEP